MGDDPARAVASAFERRSCSGGAPSLKISILEPEGMVGFESLNG
jgi:hypothetical protein